MYLPSTSFILHLHMEYEVNACRDAPDERDILYGSVAKETVTVPERVFRPVPLIHNQ